MKFEKFNFLVVTLLFSCSACSGERVSIDLTVVDEDGVPVQDVETYMSFIHPSSDSTLGSKGYTDENGRISMANRALLGVGISLTKNGYYQSRRRTGYGDQTLEMEIRKVKNPVPMTINRISYSKKFRQKVLKHKNGIAFDLEVGDFVAANGEGKVPDIIISLKEDYTSVWDYQSFVSIKFSNPMDGFVPFEIINPNRLSKSDPESYFKSAYFAPSKGFVSQWDYKSISKGKEFFEKSFNENRNYYFRVRTQTDEDGNIVSAHYGKIYGEFLNNTPQTIYFNPKPNDRNIEPDLIRSKLGKNIQGDLLP